MILPAIAVATAAGGICRYLADLTIQRRTTSPLPHGTLMVNVSGSLALGIITGLALYHDLGDTTASIAAIGFLGGYTTFSTFSYETLRLFQDGAYRHALANTAANVGLGLLAAGGGLAITAAW
jgi:fluoride exporter